MEDLLKSDLLQSALSIVVFLVEAFVLFFIGKLVYQFTHSKINVKDELVEQDNFAFAVSHAGYFLGLLIAIGGSLFGESTDLVKDVANVAIYGGIAIVLVNLSLLINDKVILRKFSMHDEVIRDQNAGAGTIEAASAISTGLIVMGAVFGEGGGIDTAVAFWAAGQVLLILATFAYNLITPFDVHEHIEKDNIAVGIGFAGAMIAIANLIRHAIMHDFEGWGTTFMWMGLDFLLGIIFLPIARFIADKILLPGQSLTDELINQEKPNNGAAIIEAFAYIGGSILITWVL